MSKFCQGDLPISYDAWCQTKFEKSDTFTFVWTISDFASRSERNIKSNDFTIRGPGDKVTYLLAKVYPNGRDEEDNGFVSVFLCNEEHPCEYEEIPKTHIECCLSSLDLDNKKLRLGDFIGALGCWERNGWPQLISKENIAQIAPTGTLTLVFDIQVITEGTEPLLVSIDCGKHTEAFSNSYHQKKLIYDLDVFYEMKELADITISCDEHEYECHKLILASRSPFFKTMFETNMKEKKTGKYVIKCMKAEVFEDVLKYIYTGAAPRIGLVAKELLEAAYRFQLTTLKERCEVTLCSQIEERNCIDLLLFGELFQASTLKNAVLKFVSNNMKKLETSEWKKKLMPNPSLLLEVIEMRKDDQEQLSFSYDVWCKTSFEKSDKFTFVWTMPDFALRTKDAVNGYMTKSINLKLERPANSPNIPPSFYSRLSLVARVYPNGLSLEEKDYVSVVICNEDDCQYNGVHVKCTLYLLDVFNKKQRVGEFVKNILPWDKQGWPKLISREDIAKIAPTGSLTLIFELQIVGKSIQTVHERSQPSEALSESYHQKQLTQDLDLSYASKEYTDITIICNKKEFECHKLILASRSKVLKKVIKVMKENESGKFEVNCKNVEVFEDMLRYIYTGIAPNIDTLAKELLEVAEEYQLQKLKELCELKLSSSVDIGNCIDLLVLSDINQASTLKTAALNFVNKNLKQIEISELKTKLSDSPSLLVKVLEKNLQEEDFDVSAKKKIKLS